MACLILKNSIFVHIPNTGGRTVRSILEKLDLIEQKITSVGNINYPDWVHPSVEELKNRGIWDFKPFKFCFVRHPIQWHLSMHRRGEPKPTAKTPLNPRKLYDKSFNIYIDRLAANSDILFNYIEAFTKDINFIGKAENSKNDLITALTLAGEDFDPSIILQAQRTGTGKDMGIDRPYSHLTSKSLHKLSDIESKLMNKYNYNYFKKEWINA